MGITELLFFSYLKTKQLVLWLNKVDCMSPQLEMGMQHTEPHVSHEEKCGKLIRDVL